MDRIGPTGISSGLHICITSNLVFVFVQLSIASKTSFNLVNRVLGVAYSGSSTQEGLPIALHILGQAAA